MKTKKHPEKSRFLRALFLALSICGAMTVSAMASLPQIVEDAQGMMIEGCRVTLDESGYHQLYVNGSFSGNFVMSDYYDSQRLANALQNNIYSGQCRYRSTSEQNYIRSLMSDLNLVNDFANYRYSNCRVRMYVDGWAHQVYVNGDFRGNYDYRSFSEMQNLQTTLVSHILAGSCRPLSGGGGYPVPPPSPYPDYPPVSRCPDPNTTWDSRLNRCVSRATPPAPRMITCSIHGMSSRSTDMGTAKRDVLARCAAASRGYVCSGSQVSCY